jgi:hypothetical protein
MKDLQIEKNLIILQLRKLCAHCSTGSSVVHKCPVQTVTREIQAIRGVPLIVNNEFKGVVCA